MKTTLFIFLLVTVLTQQAWGAEIKGKVTDENGSPLEKVLVCLQKIIDTSGCYKTRATNKRGNYVFKGLKTDQTFIVSISSGTSLAARKSNPYPNYVWSPLRLEVNLTNGSKIISDQNFEGFFNFSNFQQELQLTAADFPELTSYDITSDLVYLKLYILDQNAAENLIFLGEVADIETLQIDVSVPQAATQLYYEIYSWDRPELVEGTISLTNG